MWEIIMRKLWDGDVWGGSLHGSPGLLEISDEASLQRLHVRRLPLDRRPHLVLLRLLRPFDLPGGAGVIGRCMFEARSPLSN